MHNDWDAETTRALKAALPFLNPQARQAARLWLAVTELRGCAQEPPGGEDLSALPPHVRVNGMLRAVCAELSGERRGRLESVLQLVDLSELARAAQTAEVTL